MGFLQSTYADRPSNTVLSLSASHDVWTDDSDVAYYLDKGKGSATREPCDNPTRMSDAPISHKSGFVCHWFAVADGKVNWREGGSFCVYADCPAERLMWVLLRLRRSPN